MLHCCCKEKRDIGMDESRTAQLKKMFGTLWGELMRCSDSVGAFVVWKGSDEFYIDDNALEMLGMDRIGLNSDALMNVIECAADTEISSSPARIFVLQDNEFDNCIAGFVIKKVISVPREAQEIFPLLTQSQLVENMSSAGSDAFLMLIQLEHIGSNSDERAFKHSALSALEKALPENAVLAYHSEYKYWIFVKSGVSEPQEFAERLQNAVRCCTVTDEFGVVIGENNSMTFSGGFVAFDGRDHAAAVKHFHYASFALYEAVNEGAGTVSSFSSALYELQKNDYRKVQNFFNLLDKNSFMYHFQPIVSAKDGSIFAYEALMRTDRKYGLSPLQIIDMAAKYDRLYDIEHATMFNVMYQLSRNQHFFKKRKLFINAIPSSYLTDEDWSGLMNVYGELMEKVVIELTEQTDTSDENLDYLINRLKEHKVEMAIDDYGTGYSNTSRLIRYDPHYIKLDQSLIAGIDTNIKLRSIVSQLIDMMHSNGYLVLAEGVETAEELKVLSGMHVDLFQGFYISRPKPFFINEISESVRSEIIRYHLEIRGNADKIYHAESESREIIDLPALIREKFTGIYISGRDVEIVGDNKLPPVVMPITVKEDSECRLTLRNVSIEAETDRPAISLGSGSKLTLAVHGYNKLVKGGILVPERSELVLEGAGKLTILPESMSSYGIGNEYDLTYGKITCLMTDELTIAACGDNCVGIGGGQCCEGIDFEAGCIEITCSGANSVGIGSMSGDAEIGIHNCYVNVTAASANFVAVGTFSGNAKVDVNNVKLMLAANGNTMCGVGSKNGGTADIDIKNCELSSSLKGREIVNIGSHRSECNCMISHSAVELNCEGSMISGIGDCEGKGRVEIDSCEINISFMAANSYELGCLNGELIMNGTVKNVHINE